MWFCVCFDIQIIILLSIMLYLTHVVLIAKANGPFNLFEIQLISKQRNFTEDQPCTLQAFFIWIFPTVLYQICASGFTLFWLYLYTYSISIKMIHLILQNIFFKRNEQNLVYCHECILFFKKGKITSGQPNKTCNNTLILYILTIIVQSEIIFLC